MHLFTDSKRAATASLYSPTAFGATGQSSSTHVISDQTDVSALGMSSVQPRVVRGIRKHCRGAVLDCVEAQLEVPRLVLINPAQAIPCTVRGQPRRCPRGPDIDGVSGDMCRPLRRGDPPCRLRARAELRDRVPKELRLIGRRTPTAVDLEFDALGCGLNGRAANGTEEVAVDLGHTREVVIEY